MLAMSGYLVAADRFKLSDAAKDVPTLQCHGTSDPTVQMVRACVCRGACAGWLPVLHACPRCCLPVRPPTCLPGMLLAQRIDTQRAAMVMLMLT